MEISTEKIYLLATVRLRLESVPGVTLIFLPIKTIIYNNFFPGVTLREMLEKDLRKRLKGVQYCDIRLAQVSLSLLHSNFQASEADFIDYEKDFFSKSFLCG